MCVPIVEQTCGEILPVVIDDAIAGFGPIEIDKPTGSLIGERQRVLASVGPDATLNPLLGSA